MREARYRRVVSRDRPEAGGAMDGPGGSKPGQDEGRVMMKLAGADDAVEVHKVGIGEWP